MNILNHDFLIEKHFEELCRRPHESENEKSVSDYVVSVAQKNHLKYVQDDLWNVIVYIPATPSYKNVPPVILEAHMDMVCVKGTDVKHDFAIDPLDLYIDEKNNLHARGTTLGADDGYGCAYMLALMEEKDILHPALECVFTVQEETNTIGAEKLDKFLLKGKYMIGLDCSKEYEPDVGCFTSDRFLLEKNICKEHVEGTATTIHIHDLNGKVLHGVTNNECGNAIKMIARLMEKINGAFQIVSFRGGTLENHIPTEAKVSFVSDMNIDESMFLNAYQEIKEEYLSDNYSGYIDISKDSYSGEALCKEDSKQLIDLIYLLPNNKFVSGVEKEELVSLSNLGILETNKNHVKITGSTRSRFSYTAEEIKKRIQMISELYGYQSTIEQRYSSWPYDKNSKLRKIADSVLIEEIGKPFGEHICPGGLEIGIFVEEIEGLDAMELGAEHDYLHTTQEYLNLDSFHRSYDRLKKILERIKD